MDERTISIEQATSSFELPQLEDLGVGHWAALGPEHVAWGASFKENERYENACFVHCSGAGYSRDFSAGYLRDFA